MRRILLFRSIVVPAIYLAVVIYMLRPPAASPRYVSAGKTVVEVTDK